MADVKLNYSEDQIRNLARIGCMGYSINNYLPDTCSWTLQKHEVIEMVERIARSYIKDVDHASLGLIPFKVRDAKGVVHNEPIPCAWVWLPKNSPNLVDRSLYDTKSAIKQPIEKKSPKLLEFAAKFTPNGKADIIKGEDAKLAGLTVLIAKIAMLEFDEKNIAYAKEYGQEFKRNTELKLDCIASDEAKNGDYDIESITISKRIVRKNSNKHENRPKTSYNIR